MTETREETKHLIYAQLDECDLIKVQKIELLEEIIKELKK